MNSTYRPLTRGLCVILVVAACASISLAQVIKPAPISRDAFLQQVRVGMSKEQVRDAIGMPLHFSNTKDHALGRTAYWPERTLDPTFDPKAGDIRSAGDKARRDKDVAACVVVDDNGAVAKVFFVPNSYGLTQLTDEEARAIGFMDQADGAHVWLRNLNSLTPNVAKSLVESLNAGYVAAHLRVHAIRASAFPNVGPPDKLRLPNERVLWLGAMQTVTPELATQLAKYRGGLGLDGITSLTPQLGEILGRHEGMYLSLRGLTTIDAASAAGLSKHSPYVPYRLDGSLEDRVFWLSAESKWRLLNYSLDLRGLKSLPAEVAEALAKYHGMLDLRGVNSVTPAAARALGAHVGGLDLSGLTELPQEVAAGLAQTRPFGEQSHARDGLLDLSGVTSPSVEAARALSRHKGNIVLGDATRLSRDAAAELATHEADPWIRDEFSLKFKGSGIGSSLPDDVAKALAPHTRRMYLYGPSMSHNAWKTLSSAGHYVGAEPRGDQSRRGTWRRAYEESVTSAASGDRAAHMRAQSMLRKLTDRVITLEDMDWGEDLLSHHVDVDTLSEAEKKKYKLVLEVLAK